MKNTILVSLGGFKVNYRACWLTLNRSCNLRCKWCYARDTNFCDEDDMDLQTAKSIVDLCKDLNIHHITLIGGEPTLYSNLKEIVGYIKSKKISCGIVTNGIKLSDKEFLMELMSSGLKSFSISLKGENREAYKMVTGCDIYKRVLSGIKNGIDNHARISVSMVLTEDNIESYLEGIKSAKEMGVNNFHLSFCYDFNTSGTYKNSLLCQNPKNIISSFINNYQTLNKVTDGHFRINQSFPMCLWDPEFIKMLDSRNQITSVCQLLKRTGLIFDTNGYLIPCNAMYKLKLGKLYEDFNTADELNTFTHQNEFISAYDKLCGVPDVKCLTCKELKNCGGGCVCQWTNYDFNTLMNL